MARIRTIKPEFPQSESMGRISRDARLLFVELWTICDDSGRTRAASRMLASLLFPYDDDAPGLIDGWLDELEAEGCIVRYTAEGASYLEVRNWLSHQKIDKPSQSKIPAFDECSRKLAKPREHSSLDQGSRTKDQGTESTGSATADADVFLRPSKAPVEGPTVDSLLANVSPQVAADFKRHRTAKKAPITVTALEGIQREASKAGVTLERALKECCERGWVGFKADWFTGQATTTGPTPPRRKELA